MLVVHVLGVGNSRREPESIRRYNGEVQKTIARVQVCQPERHGNCAWREGRIVAPRPSSMIDYECRTATVDLDGVDVGVS